MCLRSQVFDEASFGFKRKVTLFAVIWWGFYDVTGAFLQCTGILWVESTVLTLALASTSTMRDSMLPV